MNIYISGSNGFIGKKLYLLATRKSVFNLHTNYTSSGTRLIDLSKYEIAGIDFSKIDCAIHLAGVAHKKKGEYTDDHYLAVNTQGTLNLANKCAASNIKRFIYISSANIEDQRCNSSQSSPPYDIQTKSKYEAEIGLQEIAKDTGMEVVIIRPPLVYGPGVKANFLNLLNLSATKLPLPFGSINNKRSMVYLDNLVDLIITCIDHPNAGNKTFSASDGDDLSLSRLLRLIRKSMNKPAWLLPVPAFVFKLAGKLTGKSDVVDRLIGDLQVDINDSKKHLDWSPPFTVEQGIKATVDDFMVKNNL